MPIPVCLQGVEIPNLIQPLRNSFTHSSTPPKLKPYIQVGDNSSYVMRVANRHDLILKRDLHFPFRSSTKSGGGGIHFVDLIHGVVCVSYSSESGFDSTILWNPAIHKYVSLPRLPFSPNSEQDAFDASAIGFGFDASTNAFKVVRIWMSGVESRLPNTYEVVHVALEGGGGIRSSVATAPYTVKRCRLYEDSRTGCFVNGKIYWIVRLRGHGTRALLMFDCKREYFRIVYLPQ